MRRCSKDQFLIKYNKRFSSISRLMRKSDQKAFLGYILNLLEGVTSVERLARQLQGDFNTTYRIIEELKNAEAVAYKKLSNESYRKAVVLLDELSFIVSQRLSVAQNALFFNREIPSTRLPIIPLRKPSKQSRKGGTRRTKVKSRRVA